jgi:dTDP-4-dehydrorhamnose 3,5-epimerase
MRLIEGVKVKALHPIHDERGWLMEVLRRDDKEFFEGFGQAYVTVCHPGVVKAWHAHARQTDHFCCLQGKAKVVLYDGREGSPTKGLTNEFFLGLGNPQLLKIPPLVQHGFRAVGAEDAMILNIPTNTYDYEEPDELRRPFDDPEIGYDWGVKHG